MLDRPRVALITGGSGAIGQGIGRRLAEDGFQVAVHGFGDADRANAVRDELRALGTRAESYQADLSQEDDAESLFAAVLRDFGWLDCLVSNAGIYPRSAVTETSAAEWDAVLGTNLRGTFLICRAAARHLRETGAGSRGRIVTISSGAASRGAVNGAHYAASKAAIIAFTKSLALELAPDRILVNCVAPGTIDTPMPRLGMTEEQLQERAQAFIPLGRLGTPADVAEVVAFLLEERVTWLTGQTIWLNGGDLLP